MKENELCELILENIHVLTCFDCGEVLTSKIDHSKTGDAVAVLHIDPGELNYPHEPDIPAVAYFECLDCHTRQDKAKKVAL